MSSRLLGVFSDPDGNTWLLQEVRTGAQPASGRRYRLDVKTVSPPKRRTSGLVSRSNAALAASVCAIAVVTLLPPPVEGDRNIHLRPLSEIGDAVLEPDKGLLLESAANILLFVPLGAALRLRGLSVGSTALISLLISVFVEAAQLLVVSGRTTSADDLVLNTLGGVLGHTLLRFWTCPEPNGSRGWRGHGARRDGVGPACDAESPPGERREPPEETERCDRP